MKPASGTRTQRGHSGKYRAGAANPTAKSSAEAAVGKRKRPRGGGLSLALDGSFEVRAQGRSWGGRSPRGTLRKHRSDGHSARPLFQSCFVERGNGFVLGTKLWTVVLAQHWLSPQPARRPCRGR